MNKALFLDLDSTVRKSKSGKITPNDHTDQEVLPGRKEKIAEYKRRGFKIVAVSNQGGIALGHTTHEKVKEAFFHLNEELGRPFDEMLYSAAHPSSNDPRRKPNAGMFHEAAAKHNIDLGQSIMVGDMETDRQAADKAGVNFRWAYSFFGDKETA